MQPAVAAQMAALADTQALSALNFSWHTASPTVPAFGAEYMPAPGPVLAKEGNDARPLNSGGVNGMVFQGPVTITDTDAMQARSFRQAQMAAARFA
jgi:hypothetical protein